MRTAQMVWPLPASPAIAPVRLEARQRHYKEQRLRPTYRAQQTPLCPLLSSSSRRDSASSHSSSPQLFSSEQNY